MSDDTLTPEYVEKAVERIRDSAGDPEAAHSMEDDLYAEVLAAVASGNIEDAKLCASIALSTRDLGFPRWCA